MYQVVRKRIVVVQNENHALNLQEAATFENSLIAQGWMAVPGGEI